VSAVLFFGLTVSSFFRPLLFPAEKKFCFCRVEGPKGHLLSFQSGQRLIAQALDQVLSPPFTDPFSLFPPLAGFVFSKVF